MPWQLEIHHIDVRSTGDATLIIARETAPYIGVQPIVRSALIDGGRGLYSENLHRYIAQQLGNRRLSIIIVTHYQNDHFGGIIRLLKRGGTARYDSVRIYDQGWPAQEAATEATYVAYVKAMNGRDASGAQKIDWATYCQGRIRATNQIQADNAAPDLLYGTRIGLPATPGNPDVITDPPQWLLTTGPAEVLWNGFIGGVPAGGAPTMRFIAVNKYVRTAAGGVTGRIDGTGADVSNEKSLGVEVTFGNFRYYVAGDIETAQENSIMTLLNSNNDVDGRVVAMKTSHHGSSSATSRAFVDRLRPAAAFVSCGTANSIHPPHPSQQTVNVLDGFTATALPHGAGIPPNRPVDYYLTGFQVPNPAFGPPLSLGGTASFTAGDPTVDPRRPGHIVVTVSQAQSAEDVRGGLWLGVATAAHAAATNPGVLGAMGDAAITAAAAAANAALSTGAAAAASAFLTSAGVGGQVAAATAATTAINNNEGADAAANRVTTAVMGAGVAQGPAAGAGAAAGVYIGGGDAWAVENAVTGALTAAGLGLVPAQAAGTAAGDNAPAGIGLFTVTYWSIGVGGNQVFTHI